MRAQRLLLALGLSLALTACSNDNPDALPIPSLTTNPPTTSAAPSSTPTSASPSPDELSPQPPLESAAPLGQPTCKGSTLTVTDADTLVDPQYAREVYSVRTSGPDCQLEGYPTVTFRDRLGRTVAVSVVHSGFGVPAQKVQPVTLSRSTSVSFEIGSARDGSCKDIASVTVTLPQTSPGHRTSTQLKVCNAKVAISPVLRRGDID
jgi:hypothetical protein